MPNTPNANFIRSRMLSGTHNLVHGVSVRLHGDARSESVRSGILSKAGLTPGSYAGVKQIHGANIAVLSDGRLDGADVSDGVVTRQTGYVVGVKTADCVPVILADTAHGVIGAVHAGWRGTAGGVVKEAVRVMLSLGATGESIHAFIGPHIGACCYTVDESRASQFMNMFGPSAPVAYRQEEVWHLGLGTANRIQLIEAGVKPANIDHIVSCTSCQIDRFYSYRKDTKETFGEMLSFVSLKDS